jgi:hypothetical protein
MSTAQVSLKRILYQCLKGLLSMQYVPTHNVANLCEAPSENGLPLNKMNPIRINVQLLSPKLRDGLYHFSWKMIAAVA